ncbi:FimV/HubP family polar landmark protein [Marinomonas transparens]|uniref:Pilus assembly protein FimV n=1 Tax=Marinomonas transparens TaxID=2795388 RepID=A0A934JNG3_9GAMM|nr:FimV/HubP family polar landmark protein [Marinomonas transparens]MBJ7539026.1 pilus assembly protein FimV [Marinomonas transparens]
MLRKTLTSIAVLGALYVSSSYALELGELTSQSTLGEPYRGKIELSDVGALLPKDILIRLGSESEFRQAGLAPTSVLSQLKFEVAREKSDIVVQISSDKALEVDELHFVLAARWPSGQVVREYQAPLKQTVLVDKSQEEVVQSSKLASTDSTSKQSVFRDAVVAAEKTPVKGMMSVSRGNTLWSIAGRNQPTNQLTIYQTMMAIQSLNKDAFSANNINLLKEGAILRLPTQEQIALFNRSMSKKEFQRQHEAWMALKGTKGSKGVSKEQLNAQAKAKAAAAKPAEGSDKLTLAAGQSALPEKSASSNAGNEQALADIKNELSASQEMLDKEKREKAELSTKLEDLNKQFETLEKLIALKDKQLAELQQQFVSAQQALQEQKNTVDQLLEADQIRREKELAEADSLMNKIVDNPIILAMGAVVLILLGFLIGLVMRRAGKKRLEKNEPVDDEFDLASSAAAAAIPATMAVAEEPEVEEPEEDPFAFDFDAADDNNMDDMAGDLQGFDEFDSEIASMDEPQGEEEAFDFPDDATVDDLETEEEAVPEDELAFGEDEFTSFEDEVEVEETSVEEEEALADLDLSEDSLEELSADDLEDFVEDDVPTVEPIDEVVEDAEISEEESFVSSLLDDTEQEDSDEESIFNKEPNESLADSIEESLAEAQDDLDELDVPEFGETEAAGDEEVSDDEEEFDFFDASGDEAATKLDLARAYMDMGDEEGARVILEDVVGSGNEQQIAEAKNMMERMFPSD